MNFALLMDSVRAWWSAEDAKDAVVLVVMRRVEEGRKDDGGGEKGRKQEAER